VAKEKVREGRGEKREGDRGTSRNKSAEKE
jgi:hypothetical protein